MSDIGIAMRQVRYENRAFWRNPQMAFFVFAFPLMFLVIFNLIFHNDQIDVPGGKTDASNFFVPAILAFGVISACYTNIAISVSLARDQGILKRLRGTPLPPWAYLVGRIAHAVLISLLLVAITIAIGALFYGVHVPTKTLPALLVTLVVGSATFCALGLALTSAIRNADAAGAVTNATSLPLMFVSDVFVHLENPPAWLSALGNIFPVKHFSLALQAAFNPFQTGTAFEFGHLAVMGVWCVAGVLLAVRTFSWQPRR